jgi:hypothetical protein
MGLKRIMSLYEKNCWNIINCAVKGNEEGTIMEQASLLVDSSFSHVLIEWCWWLVERRNWPNGKLVTLYE